MDQSTARESGEDDVRRSLTPPAIPSEELLQPAPEQQHERRSKYSFFVRGDSKYLNLQESKSRQVRVCCHSMNIRCVAELTCWIRMQVIEHTTIRTEDHLDPEHMQARTCTIASFSPGLTW